MKVGITFKLPIEIGIDMDVVERVEFIFTQGAKEKIFDYPSANAVRRDGQNIVDLIWTAAETYDFKSGSMQLDTRITMVGSIYQPETPIITVQMHPTLFEEVSG